MDGSPLGSPDATIELLGAGSAPARGHLTGHLEGVDDEGRVLFRPEGHAGSPFPVAIGMPQSDETIARAASDRRRALVVRTDESPSRHVLVGLVRDRLATAATRKDALDVTLDGEVLRLEAKERIELACGAASIVLEADGTVTISGTNIVSASRGANKIKGTTVGIN